MSVRFAPSPTGRFHVGNLRSAWISHAWARVLGRPWVLRFEDIDAPRVVSGAQALQLKDMERLGLKADRIYLQSERTDRHWELFQTAVSQGGIYPCACSRKETQEALAGLASAPHAPSPVYDGHCRNGLLPRNAKDAERLRREPIAWRFRNDVADGSQDFIIARALAVPGRDSFTPAYLWACAIDDYDGNYDLLVRAQDLAHVTPQQRALQGRFAEWEKRIFKPAAVYHTALVTDDNGARLEKRTQGVTLDELESAGCSAEYLLEAFERSHALLVNDFSPGRVFGESRATLRLGDLL